MSRNPTFEIVSDDQAVIGKGDGRYELAGGIAARIIDIYRHQLTHGEVAAQTFLLGVVCGLQHGNTIEAERMLDEIRARRRRLSEDEEGTL